MQCFAWTKLRPCVRSLACERPGFKPRPTRVHLSPTPLDSLEGVTPEMLGKAQRIAVAKERTTMIATGDFQDEVAERIKVRTCEPDRF